MDFHPLMEGTLPGDQRPLSRQMTHERRLCRSAEGKPVTLRGLGWFLERTYISCQVNRDGPGPQTHGRISKCGGTAGSGNPMLPAPGSHPLSVPSLQGYPAGTPSIHLRQVGAYRRGFTAWISLLGLKLVKKCEHRQVSLTCSP